MAEIAVSAESGGARHAALLLHAMAPADRAWMLEALPATQRDELQQLVAELETLGIASDPELIANATASIGRHAQPQRVPMSDEEMLHALDDAQLSAMVRMMRAEPIGLIVQWLRLADWPWRDRLFDALEPGHRRRVEAALSVAAPPPAPPALRAALIAAVAVRVRGDASADAPLRPWRELKQSFHRVFQGAWWPRGMAR
jgi:hypothetical protein